VYRSLACFPFQENTPPTPNYGSFVSFLIYNLVLSLGVSLLLFLKYFNIFFPMALPAHSGSRPLIQFRNHFFTDRRTSRTRNNQSQGLYLHTGQHTQTKCIHAPNIHALSRIRNHDPSVRASEDSSWLTARLLWSAKMCSYRDFWAGLSSLSVKLNTFLFRTYVWTPFLI
jgi:hypothetical protein